MTHEEAEAVHVNSCVRDDELARIEALLAAAEPGAWKVSAAGQVERYAGPIAQRGSLLLMAESVCVIPRLVRGIRVLEDALRSAWADAKSWKATVRREREEHAADLARRVAGEPGPAEDLDTILEAAELRCQNRPYLARLVAEWARGKALGRDSAIIGIERERQRAADLERGMAEKEERFARDVREVRALLAELQLTKRERAAAIAKAYEEGTP